MKQEAVELLERSTNSRFENGNFVKNSEKLRVQEISVAIFLWLILTIVGAMIVLSSIPPFNVAGMMIGVAVVVGSWWGFYKKRIIVLKEPGESLWVILKQNEKNEKPTRKQDQASSGAGAAVVILLLVVALGFMVALHEGWVSLSLPTFTWTFP